MTPDDHTNHEFMLDVGNGHDLYVQDWGNAEAQKPVLYLHGGPGGGTSNKAKTRFNPAIQRVIFFDQRGSGNSTPLGSIKHNTTDDLVGDINHILNHLRIKEAVLTGGSWGSALALIYAVQFPERVAGLVIDGIWTCTAAENSWIDQGGFQKFFPDAWARYLAATPIEHYDNPSAYHFKRALGDDVEAAKQSAYTYESLEAAVVALDDRMTAGSYDAYDPSGAQIEIHYLAHACFIPEGYVQKNAQRLTMPIRLVQGRYDMVCPPATAYALSQTVPSAEIILTTSGHYPEHESWNVIRRCLLELTEAT